MNAVEIEEAISNLAAQPFEDAKFPFAFIEAFGNKVTTIKRLRSGTTNKSDLGGVLQRSNIHIKVCREGEATATARAVTVGSIHTVATRDSHRHCASCPCAEYHRALAEQRAALGFRAAPAT